MSARDTVEEKAEKTAEKTAETPDGMVKTLSSTMGVGAGWPL